MKATLLAVSIEMIMPFVGLACIIIAIILIVNSDIRYLRSTAMLTGFIPIWKNQRNAEVNKKYRINYDLLAKYIDTYGGYEPETEADWSDSGFIYI